MILGVSDESEYSSQDLLAADLVISHAGAGTCLEVLERGKSLVVIVNQVEVETRCLSVSRIFWATTR